jgi:hypothetical protein
VNNYPTTGDLIRDDAIAELAEEYVKDVAARRQLGDENAEYHAREPKIEAYRLLLETGYSAKEAIEVFKQIAESLR